MLPLRSMARYFEDFTVGERLISAERTITAADIDTFAQLTGDFNPLHTDAVFAQADFYGQRIAHGLLVQSLASGLLAASGLLDGTAIGLRHITCKLRAPVFIGDTIHVVSEVMEKKVIRRLSVGNILVNFRVINQEEVNVQNGSWQLLVKLDRRY